MDEKLLEKEKVFPHEGFFLKSNDINAALDSIDFRQREATIQKEITDKIEKMDKKI